ncbi:MAG TPA: galactose oxidase-like domain-containing protein [Thermoanaerobaculia bacterium]
MRALCSRFALAVPPLVLAACLPLAAAAQDQPTKPFIEPSEMHHSTKALAFTESSPSQNGRWATLPYDMPLNPVHVALMHDGKVLVVSGSGNDPDNKDWQAAVWDPKTYTIRTFKIAWDMFCNGMVVAPDGRPFVLGGTLRYDGPNGQPFLGEPRASAFDPAHATFTDLPNMSGGRWYPTGTVLGNGSILVYSGLNDTNGGINPTVQIWNGKAWTPAGTAFAGVPLYPREHVLPDGKVFESGANPDSQLYDPVAHTFTKVATTIFGPYRDYGTSVLLPLTPANGFKPKVMILGGANPATSTTELIDLSVPQAQWKWVAGPPMVKARIQLNATILPNGKVLVSGGSETDEDNATAVKEAQLYDPESNSFSSASSMEFPRLYHSNTLLLPDARVVALGGNPLRKVYQPEIEVYSPPYLFNADGTPAKRPAIRKVASTLHFGASFHIGTQDAKQIKSVVLIRAGAATHAFDMDQRLVGLSFTAGAGALKAKAPANGNLAPPGYYLLFLLDAAGVPSEGRFVRLVNAVKAKK